MKYISTKQKSEKFNLSAAMLQGLAPDGGLFIPEVMPQVNLQDFLQIQDYPIFCQKVLSPFFVGDELEAKLELLCQKAFTFPLPLQSVNNNTSSLELFHGPTLSFKDFGARFLASCMSEIAKETLTIMVATSGDTGSAVAAAFHKQPNIEVIVLFPEGKISERQQKQITCWNDNVHAFAVQGTFDDCQALVKQAFADPWWQANKKLCTANSINIGRLLPQVCYYAYTSMQFYQQKNKAANFIVPSGNLGNVTAAFYAKTIGFPIDQIIIATNANQVMPDFIKKGIYEPRASIMTLANAMDVGKPSNFERLMALLPDLQKQTEAFSVTDDEIKETIKNIYEKYNLIICPHTATGFKVREKLSSDDWIVVATAHPCKFETIIEPIIQKPVPVHPNLEMLLKRENHFKSISGKLEELSKV